MIALLVTIIVGLIVVSYFAIEAEREHLQNCKNLGVQCDEARVQTWAGSVLDWLKIDKTRLLKPLDHEYSN